MINKLINYLKQVTDGEIKAQYDDQTENEKPYNPARVCVIPNSLRLWTM